jgi:hypothetical protein
MPVRVGHIGIPKVRAPFSLPAVEAIAPVKGPAGTTITFRGQHLADWKAYVRVMGKMILAQELTQDQFVVTLPADLPPGFHEMRVDISHLFRKTFFFEVVP